MNALSSLVTLVGGAVAFAAAALLEALKRVLQAVLLFAGAAAGLVAGLAWRGAGWLARATGLVALRRRAMSAPLLRVFRRAQPPMSETERAAIEAGGVWWERELFSGRPDWSRLLSTPAATLTVEERAFLDGPCEELCRMLDEWRIAHEWGDLPPEAWRFLRERGFFAMIIPKRYGGLGFSHFAHSEVLLKISSRSPTAASIVSVPNSLGPGELLLRYGTDEQREHYLPRLADGREVPCFALTSATAGSDATSIRDTGVVCKGMWEGREVVGLRLNWDKRYITLAPVATLLGLAFKLHDPDRLLGSRAEYGITCALVPTHLPGVTIGRRHLPLHVPFQNGPTSGRDVFVPVDHIIGGPAMAGHGWRMLVENLSVGRSISLPANAIGGAKLGLYATGVYARVRRQFRVPLAAFEGIQEALARMAGNVYTMDAARRMTLAALDQGDRPAVASAILKYHVTQLARTVGDDAMDIHGGKGIMLGPGNYLAPGWLAGPIAITVEGANILTRCLIIFGQGAIRAHPYVLAEMEAAGDRDRQRGLREFDRALFRHAGFLLGNAARAALAAASGGRTALAAPPLSVLAHRYRTLSRESAAFALLADTAMLTIGGALKRRERLSARLGDLLSFLYLGSAVLKRYADTGEPAADRPVVDYALDELERRFETTAAEILANLPHRAIAATVRALILPRGPRALGPADALAARVAALVTAPTATRQRLTEGIFTADRFGIIGTLDETLGLAPQAEAIEKRVRAALAAGSFAAPPGAGETALARAAAEAGVVAPEEAERLVRFHVLVERIIAVDDFDSAELAAVPLADNETDRVAAWRQRMNVERAATSASVRRDLVRPGDSPASADELDAASEQCCAA
ncbi:MAG: acyl-CoA dehydrogenase [Deltaproteobacteria bacterium]|nr:acyl-CoA dehydrogenase [Deltaproteobacteria bacterium]